MPVNPGSLSFVYFLRWFAITALAGVAIVIIFVAIVDPYGLYKAVERDGLNSTKPRLTRYQNEIKLAQAASIHANGVIVGNSRAEIGFDPDSPILPKSSMPFYNLAIPGTSIETAKQQLEQLHKVGIKPKTVILGMEFLDFIEAGDGIPVPAVTAAPAPGKNKFLWLEESWRFDILFSLASVKDAIRTLIIQHDDEAATMTAKGFNPLNDYKAIVRNDGYHNLFQQRAHEIARAYLKKASTRIASTEFQNLRAILNMSAKTNAEVKLVIYPYHAQILILFERTQLWRPFEQWKDMLVAEVDMARQRYPSVDITLVDFTGYSEYNCERIPRPHDRSGKMLWYWEAGHFKKELGDVVLKSLFDSSSTHIQNGGVGKGIGSFGMALVTSNSTENRRRIFDERIKCVNFYPGLFTQTERLVDRIGDKNLSP